MVEVDISSCGIGVVLSQCHRDHGKIHPCAYFSRKSMPAEANYDGGNQELLSIKAVLDWLEGAQPLCCPDGSLLSGVLAQCKKTEPLPSPLGIVFYPFPFLGNLPPRHQELENGCSVLPLCPLSTTMQPEPILPSSIILAPVQWDLMGDI